MWCFQCNSGAEFELRACLCLYVSYVWWQLFLLFFPFIFVNWIIPVCVTIKDIAWNLEYMVCVLWECPMWKSRSENIKCITCPNVSKYLYVNLLPEHFQNVLTVFSGNGLILTNFFIWDIYLFTKADHFFYFSYFSILFLVSIRVYQKSIVNSRLKKNRGLTT